ncbi:MAG: nickel-responsive transcriptional regulator NikR [Vulcanibacillus sp.]
MSEQHLTRFGVSMDKELLNKFDKLIENKGYKNRSEAVRDLVREALVKQVWEEKNQYVAGSILIFYDHHQNHLIEEITDIQHNYHDQILGTMHFHIDKHNCLELIIIKGKANELQLLSDQIISLKGVNYGKFTVSPIENV